MKKIDGYIAAPFTPMYENGDVNLDFIPEYSDFIIRNGLDGVFICGSTGEGALLTREERMAIAERWIKVGNNKLKIIVHTGGANIRDQQQLATHAEKIGAWSVAAMAPSFLPPGRIKEFVAYCREIASAAPGLPFYYYHIPALNGFRMPVPEFLKEADAEIPNLAGVKFTDTNMFEFEQCRHVANGKFELLWGADEMFFDSLVYGNTGGVGGTYNHCFGLYNEMRKVYALKDMKRCSELQHKSHLFVDILHKYRGNLVGGKRIMKLIGMDCGPNRLPLQNISKQEETEIKKELEAIDFFSFCNR
jgi:N-acetylneuraminate lyase